MHACVFQSALFQPSFTGAKNLYASALTSEQLSCSLLTSAACLWATPGSTLPCSLRCPPLPCSKRHFPVLTLCLDRCFALTSPDALFSIVLKPPTGVFSTTDRRFFDHRPAFFRPPAGFRPATGRLPTGHRPTFFKKKKICVPSLTPGGCQSCSLPMRFPTWRLGDADRAL